MKRTCITAALFSALCLSGCASVPPSPYGPNTQMTPTDHAGSLADQLHRARTQAQKAPRDVTAQHNYFYDLTRYATIQVQQIHTALKQNQFTEAESALNQLLQEEPDFAEAGTLRNMITQARIAYIRLKQAKQLFQAKHYTEAYQAVTQVLANNPDNIDALTLQAALMQHQLEMHTTQHNDALDAILHKPISLSYKNATLANVFNSFSQLTHLNFFFDPDINLDQNISFFIQKSPTGDALDGILSSVGLTKKSSGGLGFFIYPLSKQQHYEMIMIRSFPITHTDPKSIAASLRTLLDLHDIVIDSNQQTIIIKDTEDKLRAAERIILLEDQPAPEVELEMSIIELSKEQALNLGLQWPSHFGLTPLPSTAGGSLTLADLKHLNSQRIGAQFGTVSLSAQDSNEAAQILANPRIRVKNNEKAKIQIGNRYPIISSTSTSTGLVSDNVSFVDVGLKLEVTPNISEDNEVTLNVNLEVSNIINQMTTKDGNPIYVIGNRNATTVLRLNNEETQILGGLISNNIKRNGGGLPGGSRLPLLGYLFGSRNDENSESEVILSITPHIIRSGYNFNAATAPIIIRHTPQPNLNMSAAMPPPLSAPTQELSTHRGGKERLQGRLYDHGSDHGDMAPPRGQNAAPTHDDVPPSLFGNP